MNRIAFALVLSLGASFLLAAAGIGDVITLRPKPKPFEVLLDASEFKADFSGFDTSDIDSDADEDFVFVDTRGALYIAENKGRGEFEMPRLVTDPLMEAAGHVGLQLADIDSDNDEDVLLIDSMGSVYKILHEGRDRLTKPEKLCDPLNAKPGPASVAMSDIDSDNDVDILVLNSEGIVYCILNTGMGTYADAAKLFAIEGIRPGALELALADLDFDNDEEVLVADATAAIFKVVNRGSGSFEDPEKIGEALNPTPGPVTLAIADMDWDGDDDLFVLVSDGSIYSKINKGRGVFDEAKKVLESLDESAGRIRLAISGEDPGYADDIVALNSKATAFMLEDTEKGRFAGSYQISEPFDEALVLTDTLLEDINGDGAEDTLILDEKGVIYVLRADTPVVVDGT